MERLAQTCEAIAGTTKKTLKTRLLADYLSSCTLADAATSAVFFSGRPFPAYDERTLGVGGSLLWTAVGELAGKNHVQMSEAYRRHGDLGSAAYDLLVNSAPRRSTLTVQSVKSAFDEIAAARGAQAKAPLVLRLLAAATALEAKYIVKIITSELRIGLKESLVEDAIALAYAAPAADVRRANMLLGDIGETLRMAQEKRLHQAHMRMFHPLGFMLASPVESETEAFEYFEHAAVEDKYDGIRAQAHIGMKNGNPHVRLFSRTLDDVTNSFPEIESALKNLQGDIILDGEILAWDAAAEGGGRALPFSTLQTRLGRKSVTARMMQDIPIAYVVFDVLYANEQLLLDLPLRERLGVLDTVLEKAPHTHVDVSAPQGTLFEPALETASLLADGRRPRVIRAPGAKADSPQQLEEMFRLARDRGNEGLMVKDLNSTYAPGRRGKSWLKLKRELSTLDVVVTSVEYGHGKRAGVLSDYTFAVRSGDHLLNVGKAYSGLTDKEIAGMTQWFLDHTLEDRGFSLLVEPKIVLEVAFNAVMQSERHESGYALRFPRIVRLRSDKPVEEINTLEDVKQIYEGQFMRAAG
jgi:DNA ligase 1